MNKEKTIEEFALKLFPDRSFWIGSGDTSRLYDPNLNDRERWIQGAKWQEEQDKNKYSEDDVEDLLYKVCGTVARLQGITLNGNHINTAYKQFKKK
jgi:hypothetical protein